MEELKSTDILDKEIQAEARKRSEQILTSADKECSQILSSVPSRLEESKKQKKADFEKKILQYKKDMEASIPLEKQRFVVSFLGDSVAEEINNYLKDIDQNKRMKLVSRLLNHYKPIIGSKKVHALVYGYDLPTMTALLKEKLGSQFVSSKKINPATLNEDVPEGLDVREGVILEAEDKSFRCRMTLEELVAEIQDKYSEELATTLFCGRLPK